MRREEATARDDLAHFDLLNQPAIYDQIKLWIGGRPGELSAADPAAVQRP